MRPEIMSLRHLSILPVLSAFLIGHGSELALPFPIGRLEDPLFARAGVEAWATSPNDLELRGDIARLCVGRVGDPASKESIAPIVQTRPSFVQRFAFTATSGRAFVKVFVGHRSIGIK